MTLTLWKKSHDKPIQHIKKQIFANKSLYSQSYGFSSSQIQMWELDHKECWAPKNWYFQTVLKKTLDSLLVCKETKPVNFKGNQPWIFIGRTDQLVWSWSSHTLATWCEEPIHWKRLWCWKRLKAGEGVNRGWDGWIASSTQWIRVWANSRK